MGAVNFSIDHKLIQLLDRHLPLNIFIETGTFTGDTLSIIKDYFKCIYSIELSESYYQAARAKFHADKHITLIHDDSVSAFATLLPDLRDKPIVYWLDAHWCVANATAGQTSQCPLLGELALIGNLNQDSIIIIDDARLFLASPPSPYEISQWPTLHSIVEALLKLSTSHQLSVINDCILFAPISLNDPLKIFAQENGIDWLDISNRCRDSEALLQQVLIEKDKLEQKLLKLKNICVQDQRPLTIKSFCRQILAKLGVVLVKRNALVDIIDPAA